VIVGFSPPSSTLLTASWQCPEKIILSLDLKEELLGDSYKDFEEIEYINTKERLINILNLIKKNAYRKNYIASPKLLESKEFSDTTTLLEYLSRTF